MKKTEKKTDLPVTVITAVVDESGSMSDCWKETISGFNAFVVDLQAKLMDAEAYISVLTFDTGPGDHVRILQNGADLKGGLLLKTDNYTPRGGTPLYDAVGKAIKLTDEIVAKRNAKAVTVMIQTDGHENSSQEFKHPIIKQMIEDRQKDGWLFIFMGADLKDAHVTATDMGFQTTSVMSYGKKFTNSAFMSMSASTTRYAGAGGMMGPTGSAGALRDAGFTEAERTESGEDKLLGKKVPAK